MNLVKYIGTLTIFLSISSCEEVIKIDLEDAPSIIVIDAWINNKTETQKISIKKSQAYFDNSSLTGISEAVVSITSSKETIRFTASSTVGEYLWEPKNNPTFFADIGEKYTLNILLADGTKYISKSQINRVPEVEDIKFTFKKSDNRVKKDGYEGEFLATDPQGSDDTYWIKAYKNGKLLNKPFEINIAYDAGFSKGGNVDGVVFIQPIQSGVQPLDDELVPIRYQTGDSLSVEIHSITNEAYFFLEKLKTQTQRNGGFDEIFAQPFANVSTNIVSSNSEEQIAGFFSVSAVSVKGKKLKK